MPRLLKEAWKHIGTSETILKWIDEGVPLQFDEEDLPEPRCLQNRVHGSKQEHFVDGEVASLLQRQAIREVNREEIVCVLPLRCVPKK